MWFSNENFITFLFCSHYGIFLMFSLANILNLVNLRLTRNLPKVLYENLLYCLADADLI